jgi:raffinose/stachyose/melibiose transport system permease protein
MDIMQSYDGVKAAPSRRWLSGVGKTLIYIFLTLWSVTTIVPFIWVLLNSFKTSDQIMNASFAIPKTLNLQNYINAFGKMNVGRAYLNSLIISGMVMVVVILFAGLASYGLARYRFKLRPVILSLVIASLMFPAFCTIIPVFGIIFKLHLLNNPLGVILPQIAGNLSFAIIILIGNIESLPVDMEESAYMEGCNIVQVFFKIVMPLQKPAFATVAIFSFLWSYNDLFTQLFFLRYKESYTITRLLNEISSAYGTDYGLMAASVVLVVIPVMIVYVLLQNNIIKGLTAGAVKG